MPAHAPDDGDAMVPLPVEGRVFATARRVRLGDASPAGRLRLDATARFLQDVSDDDTRDAGTDDGAAWVVRRLVLHVERFPVVGEELALATFCSGTGPCWAERRVTVTGDRGGALDAATLWVHLDRAGRPARLPEGFFPVYGEAAGGRTVRGRLRLGSPPAPAPTVPWPLRFTDFDVLGHVNNAAAWAAVEEVLAARRHLRAPLRAELEFRTPLEPGVPMELAVVDGEDGGVAIWFLAAGKVAAGAVVRTWRPDQASV